MALTLLTPLDLTKFVHLFPDELLDQIEADEIIIGYVEEDPLKATGILMAHVEELEVMIDWLFVDEDYRRRGAGKAMLNFLIKSCEQIDELGGVSIIFTQEHESMKGFLDACEFFVIFEEGHKGFETTLGDFPKFPVFGPVGEVMPITDVPERELARFSEAVNNSAIPGAAVDIPFGAANYLPESTVVLEDGKIKGVCLMEEKDYGLSLSWAYNLSSEASNFPALLNKSIKLLRKKYDDDTVLGLASLSAKVDEIIETYIPVKKSSEIYLGTYPFGIDFDQYYNAI